MKYKRGLIQAFDEHQECAIKITKTSPGDNQEGLRAVLTANAALLGRTVALGFLAVVEAVEGIGETMRLKD